MTSASLPQMVQLTDYSLLEFPIDPGAIRAFVTRYLLDYDGDKAAFYAGISIKDGKALLRHPEVMALIAEMQAAREKVCIIGKDFAALQWLEVLPKLKGEVAVPLVTKNGSAVEEKKFFASELVRALVEIGNIAGLSKSAEAGPKKPAVNISLNFSGMASQTPHITVEGDDT